MKSILKICSILVTIMSSLISNALCQNPLSYNTILSSKQMKSDFKEMQDSLQKLHPGLYRYQNKTSMDEIFQNAYRQLEHQMSETAFFMILSRVISQIEDGHTECFLPREVIGSIISGVTVFPIQPKFIGNSAFIRCNTREFPAGTEITSINGQSVNQIRKELFSLLSSDGSIQTGKYVKINDGHDPFSYLYLVAFGQKKSFYVGYLEVNGKPAVKVIMPLLFGQMECPTGDIKIDKYLNLDYKENGVAVMTLRTFANEYLKGTKEDFSNFLAAAFKELKDKNINKLIIDLRENGGGEDTNGLLLYRYLTDKPFRYYNTLSTTTHVIADHPNLQLQQPEPDNFKGKVEFLISGKSFSGAAEFSSIARSNKRGVFIGEETGGGYLGNTSGGKVTLELYNSHIRLNIPTTRYEMAVKTDYFKDRGIVPECKITPTINDLLQHKDIQMDFALKQINK